jgi:nitrogen fixation NifU-like protein
LFLKIDDGKITDASFQGQGCAISTASASLMTDIIKGQSEEEAQKLFELFHNMATGEHVEMDELGKLAVLAGVCEYPARVKCATLPWHTLDALLKGVKEPVTTE